MPHSPKLALADDAYVLRGVPTLVPNHGTDLLVAFVSPTPPRGQVFANEVHVVLLEPTLDGVAGRYRRRDAAQFVHIYTYDAELDDDDRAGSRFEMAFVPSDPTALIAWTWDAPTLYKLHVDPRHGVHIVSRRDLGFRPVKKANFGLGMYFTRDGRFVHLVSTCPWDDYQFDAHSLQLLQRTRSCPWPYASISYVGYSSQVLVPADALGALVALELNSRSFLGLQLPNGDHLHISLGATQLSLFPCQMNGHFALSATALHEKRRYHGVFRDIWHLLEISPLQLQPWVHPAVQWPRTPDGDFDDDDDAALAPMEATPTITYALAFDLPDAPWVEVTVSSPSTHYLRCSPLRIDGDMYQLDIVRPHTALIRHPISNACVHVLQYNEYDDIEILHVLSRGNVLSWTSPFLLASAPLQLATPMVYKPIGNGILPTDDAVFQAVAFHYADDSLMHSALSVLGSHTLAMVLSAGYLCLADLLTMLRVLPSVRRDCFRHAEMRRRLLRTHYLDCVESTFLWPDDAAHYEAKAASLLLFLTTIDDEEAYELLAASAYFKLRGERRDRTLAQDYLEMLPPKSRTLHGKNDDVVVLHVSA